MNEYLERYAIDTIWCNPYQDRQWVYRLARVSKSIGARKAIWNWYENITLPDQDNRWMVYQLGAVATQHLNLPTKRYNWISLAELAEDGLLFTDLYTADGIQFPRFESFLIMMPGDGCMIATRVNPRVNNLEDRELYIRFYTNAYYESTRSAGKRQMRVIGQRFESSSDVVPFQRKAAKVLKEYGGTVFCYVNGRFVNEVNPSVAGKDDVVEYVFDQSITRVETWRVKDLPSFTSKLDKERKYLLHYNDRSQSRIDYKDDIDVYLIKPLNNKGKFEGVYYHHNNPDWMRMVTHKDYSVPVSRIQGFINIHPKGRFDDGDDDWALIDDLVIRLYIRESGFDRPLQPNSSRIQELYRLPDEQIQKALLGIDSDVDFWKAEELEISPYIRMMSLPKEHLFPIYYGDPLNSSDGQLRINNFSGDVFGANAAGRILANTPVKITSDNGYPVAVLPYEFWTDATVYEYDEDGLLIDWHYHVQGKYYQPQSDKCVLVDAISGYGARELREDYTDNNGGGEFNAGKGYNLRLYVETVWGGENQGDWKDITHADDLDKYGELTRAVEDETARFENKSDYGDFVRDLEGTDTMKWNLSPTKYRGLARSDKQFITKRFNLRRYDGLLEFSVNGTEVINNVPSEYVIEVPLGQLDVWLNGHALQPGLDYVLKWPQVIISNREYIDWDKDDQEVCYRAYSFPDDETLQPFDYTEGGFIRYGVLSDNNIIDVWRNKVMRFVCDGRTFLEEDIELDEDNGDLKIEGVRNGAPYFIQRPPVIFHDVYTDDIAARKEDDKYDQQVADYLTEFYPVRVRDNPDMINYRYTIISCFANKVLIDLLNGVKVPDWIEGRYSQQDIREHYKDYEWILDYDLTHQGIDDKYCIIRPHWFPGRIEIDYYVYQLYVKTMNTYLGTILDVTEYVTIKQKGSEVTTDGN